MGKKKRGHSAEPKPPSRLDRLFANRIFVIAAGVMVVAVFAGLAILVVTLLGGDELSDNSTLEPPSLVSKAQYEPSEIASLFSSTTWDEMDDGEREQVESALKDTFNNATFRASSGYVKAIDVTREGGETLLSRQYIPIEAPNGRAFAEQMLLHCVENGVRKTYRYSTSPIQSDFSDNVDENVTRPAWDSILDGTYWPEANDLGFKTSERTNRLLHGLELPWAENPAQSEDGRPTQYWFDAETGQLMERGTIIEGDEASTEANWYYLDYGQPPPLVIPGDLEKPACVENLISRSGF